MPQATAILTQRNIPLPLPVVALVLIVVVPMALQG